VSDKKENHDEQQQASAKAPDQAVAVRDRNRRRPDAPPSSMPSDKGHDVSVELRSVLPAEPGVGFDGREEAGGQRDVDAFEELQEKETDRVAVRADSGVSAGAFRQGPWREVLKDRSAARV
jgi:hypothetical protein